MAGMESALKMQCDPDSFSDAVRQLSTAHHKEVAELRSHVHRLASILRRLRSAALVPADSNFAEVAAASHEAFLELAALGLGDACESTRISSDQASFSLSRRSPELPVEPRFSGSSLEEATPKERELSRPPELHALASDGAAVGASFGGQSIMTVSERHFQLAQLQQPRGSRVESRSVSPLPRRVMPHSHLMHAGDEQFFKPSRVCPPRQGEIAEPSLDASPKLAKKSPTGAGHGQSPGSGSGSTRSTVNPFQLLGRMHPRLQQWKLDAQQVVCMSPRTGNLPPDSEMLSQVGSVFHVSSVATSAAASAGSHEEDMPFAWLWKHSSGWRPYTRPECLRIEEAFQRGRSKVRLKTGKWGTTPMEIHFSDMIQYDPITGNTRPVMREGSESQFLKFQRNANIWLQRMRTGRQENFDSYQQRRVALQGNAMTSKTFKTASYYHSEPPPLLGYRCAQVAQSELFHWCVNTLIILNTVWLVAETGGIAKSRTWGSGSVFYQVVEIFFALGFMLEVTIRFIAFRRKLDCLRDGWFRFDATLSILTLVEIALVNWRWQVSPVLRLMRMARLTRLGRLFRVIPELLIMLKGIIAALGSVCATLSLLLLLLFGFAAIFEMRLEERPELREEFFRTMMDTMTTLIYRGFFLDSPTAVHDFLVRNDEIILAWGFIIFICFSSLTLMNLMIGILCQVAKEVAFAEKECAGQHYLEANLLEVLACYDEDDDGEITADKFELILLNPDVNEVLAAFGVDREGLSSLGSTLWKEKEKCTFGEFLALVKRLRNQKNAHVKDIVELREFVQQHFKLLQASMKEEIGKQFKRKTTFESC